MPKEVTKTNRKMKKNEKRELNSYTVTLLLTKDTHTIKPHSTNPISHKYSTLACCNNYNIDLSYDIWTSVQ